MTKELIEESDEESISELFEESDEESGKMFKESTKIKSSNKDKNTADWYDKNKLRKYYLLLAITVLIIKIK